MAILALVLILAACGSGNEEEGKKVDAENEENKDNGNNVEEGTENQEVAEFPTDPVTIRIAQSWHEEMFEDRTRIIMEKHPHITIESVPFSGKQEDLEELFANNVEFDIILSSNIPMMEDYELVYPLDDLVEKYGFELTGLNPGLVNFVRSKGSDNSLVGFPDGTAFAGLFYNKDVFDEFGVPYPDPDVAMTWEETFALAAKMTGTRDGVDYVGLEFDPTTSTRLIPLTQLGLNMTDPETGEVLLTKEPGFHRYLTLMEDFLNIPGIPSKSMAAYEFRDKKGAMVVAYHRLLANNWSEADGNEEYKKNMDIVPIPVWPDLPNTGRELQTTAMIISNHSENKDAAFQVLMEYVGKDSQLEISRTMGSGFASTDPEVQEQFGAAVPDYDGKNVAAFFKHNPVLMDVRSQWDTHVNIAGEAGALEKLIEGIDINTILREISEDAESKIKDAKADQ